MSSPTSCRPRERAACSDVKLAKCDDTIVKPLVQRLWPECTTRPLSISRKAKFAVSGFPTILLLDAKENFSKQGLFMAGWKALYGNMIEWVPLSKDGKVTKVVDDMTSVNGLAFSPDEKYLYVNASRENYVNRYEVRVDGTLTNGKLFADMRGLTEELVERHTDYASLNDYLDGYSIHGDRLSGEHRIHDGFLQRQASISNGCSRLCQHRDVRTSQTRLPGHRRFGQRLMGGSYQSGPRIGHRL